jgi:hypothetical protein
MLRDKGVRMMLQPMSTNTREACIATVKGFTRLNHVYRITRVPIAKPTRSAGMDAHRLDQGG